MAFFLRTGPIVAIAAIGSITIFYECPDGLKVEGAGPLSLGLPYLPLQVEP
jgi:hypothetical protein